MEERWTLALHTPLICNIAVIAAIKPLHVSTLAWQPHVLTSCTCRASDVLRHESDPRCFQEGASGLCSEGRHLL